MTFTRLLSNRLWAWLASCWLIAASFGCGQPNAAKSAPVADASQSKAEELPVVPRVEFQNWSKFPVGTVVTRVRQVGEGTGKVTQTTRYKLAEKSDTRVVIEPNVEIDGNGRHEQNDMGTIVYASTFRLPTGMTEVMFSQPDPKAESQGTELVELLGKSVQAEVYTWRTSAEAGPVSNKLWMSNDIPGACDQASDGSRWEQVGGSRDQHKCA